VADKRDDEEILARLDEDLAEAILDLSDEEIADAIKADGENPATVAASARSLIGQAIDRRAEALRRKARKDYEAAVVALTQSPLRLPHDPKARRSLLQAAASRQRSVGLTLQHRDLTSLSDEDVESQLKKLHELGFIDDAGNIVGDGE
jgi:hypothetical protein